MTRAGERTQIVIVGGGFAGAYAGQTLTRQLPKDADLVLIDRSNYLLFYPLLIEAGVGMIEPRHVVVPIRHFLPDTNFIMAEVTRISLEHQSVTFRVVEREEETTIHFDHLILAAGSTTRCAPIPGLQEHALQLKTLHDAIELRDRSIRLLEYANTIHDRSDRRDVLRHIVVGASFTGVEFAGEFHAFLQSATRDYHNINRDDIEMIILEHGDHILPAVRPDLGLWAERALLARGVQVRQHCSIASLTDDTAQLTNGEVLKTRTVLWAAGITPNPVLKTIEGLPLNEKGYIDCEPDLRVKGLANVWAIGDNATVLNAEGKPYPATAQTATRQGKAVAKNVLATLSGAPTTAFFYKPLGSFAAIGNRSAAAEVMGWNLKGFLGWVVYRGVYLMKMPTFSMKVRLGIDWLMELLLPSQPVQLGLRRTDDP